MSETQERQTGIKRLEKRKGRLWGFIRREAPGTVEPLNPLRMTQRLRHLMMSSIKTTGSYLRRRLGERGLTSMFEHQADEFASSWMRTDLLADALARNTILYNFQPLGMDANYSGDAEVATIVVESCPLPQRFLTRPEFLEERSYDMPPLLTSTDFASDTLTSRGDWPPKKVESCNVCRIVMPKMGERLGFDWEVGLTEKKPRRCTFTIRVKPKK
jgi:hypothetical protein